MPAEAHKHRRQPLGSFIRSQRRLAALSLRQLADMTSVSYAYLSQIERGIHQPSLRVLRSLAEALDLPTTVLLEHAGLGEVDASPDQNGSTTATAIATDAALSEPDRALLLDIYQRLRRA